MARVTRKTPSERTEAITEVFSGCVDYYPYGMPMPSRQRQADSLDQYRFGFQGIRKGNQLYGDVNPYKSPSATTISAWAAVWFVTTLFKRLNHPQQLNLIKLEKTISYANSHVVAYRLNACQPSKAPCPIQPHSPNR